MLCFFSHMVSWKRDPTRLRLPCLLLTLLCLLPQQGSNQEEEDSKQQQQQQQQQDEGGSVNNQPPTSQQQRLEAALEAAFHSSQVKQEANVTEQPSKEHQGSHLHPSPHSQQLQPQQHGTHSMGYYQSPLKQQRSPRKQQQQQRLHHHQQQQQHNQQLNQQQHNLPPTHMHQQQRGGGGAVKRQRVDPTAGSNGNYYAAAPLPSNVDQNASASEDDVTASPSQEGMYWQGGSNLGQHQMGPHGQQFTCSVTEQQATHDGFRCVAVDENVL